MDADFDLSVLWSALWRSRYTILRPTIAVAILTFVVVLLIPPRYQSESRVLVVGRDNIYLRPDVDRDITDRNAIDAEAVTSQAQLVLSRDLALEVINKLKLGERPEFDPAVGGISLIRTALGFVGLVKNPKGLTPEERTLDAFYDRLTVYPVDKSRVIVIDFLSEDPELAARVANAVADAYLERQQFAKQDQARSAGAWLSGEIESLRKKVADAEGKVEQFRAKSNLLAGPNNTTLSAQQLGDLNGQLAAARTLKATAQAKAKIIREMLKSGGPIESSEILNSELIRRLSEQRVTLRAQLAEQSSSLLANHPRIKELKAQIADLDQQIRQEADTQARALENDSKLADARVDAQLATLDHFKGQVATGNEQDVELRALERDAKSQRDLLESYLAKYREASARDTIASAPPDARIISRAMVSSVPAYPKKLPTVLITTLATLVLASGMVLTREFLASPAIGAVGGAQRPARRLPPVRAMRSPERETEIGMERRDTRRRPEPEFAREPEAESVREPEAEFGREPEAEFGREPERNFTREPERNFSRDSERDFARESQHRTEYDYSDLEPRFDPYLEPELDFGRAPEAAPPRGVSLSERLATLAKASDPPRPSDPPKPPAGVRASAIEQLAQNLRRDGSAGSQIAFFGVTPELDTTGIAIKLARVLAADSRVLLLSLGAGDAAIRAISNDPGAPGLAGLAARTASFGDIIARDKSSGLNLIVSGGRPGDPAALLTAPGMAKIFAALAKSYAHVVIDAGAIGQTDLRAIATLAPQAALLVETLTDVATDQAGNRLEQAGFDDITIMVAGRADDARDARANHASAAA